MEDPVGECIYVPPFSIMSEQKMPHAHVTDDIGVVDLTTNDLVETLQSALHLRNLPDLFRGLATTLN